MCSIRDAREFVATQMNYFDVETNEWKCFPSMATLDEATACFCAEYVGNYLYVAATKKSPFSGAIYRYHSVNNEWETLPYFQRSHSYPSGISCLCSVGDYIFAITKSNLLQRYSLAQNKWQSGTTLPFLNKSDDEGTLTSAAVVMKSKIYVLFGRYRKVGRDLKAETAVFYCFNPQNNEWKEKAWTSHPHFGSVLFVDNNKLYVAGGKISFNRDRTSPQSDPAPVEVYDEVRNRWSVVEQKHIPPNNLGAVEINEKVYFIINNFPVDIGIRIPPGEVYHISLQKWEEGGIGRISEKAVLCYLPVKKGSLKAKPPDEKKSDVQRNFRKN